jgi:pimeloyl-ACP methyl ester carboxylesterase
MAMLTVGSEEDARLVEVADAPHGLALTHPNEVNEAILAFLVN